MASRPTVAQRRLPSSGEKAATASLDERMACQRFHGGYGRGRRKGPCHRPQSLHEATLGAGTVDPHISSNSIVGIPASQVDTGARCS